MRSPRPMERVLWTFWLLTLLAVAAAGSLSAAARAGASPITGLRVALSGLVLLVALVLATRVLIGLERARRKSTPSHPEDN